MWLLSGLWDTSQALPRIDEVIMPFPLNVPLLFVDQFTSPAGIAGFVRALFQDAHEQKSFSTRVG